MAVELAGRVPVRGVPARARDEADVFYAFAVVMVMGFVAHRVSRSLTGVPGFGSMQDSLLRPVSASAEAQFKFGGTSPSAVPPRRGPWEPSAIWKLEGGVRGARGRERARPEGFRGYTLLSHNRATGKDRKRSTHGHGNQGGMVRSRRCGPRGFSRLAAWAAPAGIAGAGLAISGSVTTTGRRNTANPIRLDIRPGWKPTIRTFPAGRSTCW